MVDINLIGEEEKHEARLRDDNLSESLNLEGSDYSTSPNDYRSDFPELEPSGGNKKLYVIIVGLLAITALFVYFLIPKEPTEEEYLDTLSAPETSELLQENQQPANPPAATQTTPAPPNTAEQRAAAEETTPPATNPTSPAVDRPVATQPSRSFASLSPAEQQMISTLRLGHFTVNTIANALSGGAVLSLIRFTDNAFLVEFVTSSNNIGTVSNTLRQRLNPVEMNIVSQEAFGVKGPAARKVLVAGAVGAGSSPISLDGTVREISLGDFVQWIRNAARSNGLAVKNLNQSSPTQQDAYSITPLQIILRGDLSGALAFLDALDQSSPNVSVEKISLINNDPSANSDDAVSMVVVLQHYSPF